MASETWMKQWTEQCEKQFYDDFPEAQVFVDGRLLTSSRRGKPGEYLWRKGDIELPVFAAPLRANCFINVVVMPGGAHPTMFPAGRRDYRVLLSSGVRQAPAGEPVIVEKI